MHEVQQILTDNCCVSLSCRSAWYTCTTQILSGLFATGPCCMSMCVCVCVCVCVGEWSTRHWLSTENIHWRQVAWSLITGQWRSRVGRWLPQWSHSTAEQWTTTTTRPHWHKLSTQAVAANTIMLRWTLITTLRCTLVRLWVVVVQQRRRCWRWQSIRFSHLSLPSTLRD